MPRGAHKGPGCPQGPGPQRSRGAHKGSVRAERALDPSIYIYIYICIYIYIYITALHGDSKQEMGIIYIYVLCLKMEFGLLSFL